MLTTNDTTAISNPVAQNRSKSSISEATAASDFQSFLKLLTAQLRNQDPLSPLESTQFVEQLASFSAVEQQIETNKLLRDLVGGATESGLEGATLWIGKEVETELGLASYAGSPLEFRIMPSSAGEAGEIVVRNASDAVVYREAVKIGQSQFSWNGRTEDGAAAPYSDYKITVNYLKDGQIAETKPLSILARVTEARLSGGALQLVLDNGAIIEPAAITAVREPKSSNVLAGDI